MAKVETGKADGGLEKEPKLKGKGDVQKVEAANIIAEFLKNLLAKKGLKGLPEVLGKVSAEPDASVRKGLVEDALKAIKGEQAEKKIVQHGRELVEAVMGDDKAKLQGALEKVLGKNEDQGAEEKAATSAAIGWFEAGDGSPKTQKIKELKTKAVEMGVRNQEEVERGLDALEKVNDLSEEQKKDLVRQMLRANDAKKEEGRKEDRKRADKKLEQKEKEEARKSWRDTESVRTRADLGAVRRVLHLVDTGEVGLLDNEDIRNLLEPGILGMEADGTVGFGDQGKKLVEGLESAEKAVVLGAIKAVRENQEKRVESAPRVVRGRQGAEGSRRWRVDDEANPMGRMGMSEGRSEEEFNTLREAVDAGIAKINKLDEMKSLSPEQLNAILPENLREDRLGKITNKELKSYLEPGPAGSVRINPDKLRGNEERFKELYFDMAVQAARKMFNKRVDSRGMDVYYDPDAMEYIAIKSIQGIFELDESMIDAIKLKSTMMYLGDAMEGGYHDPKEMLQIMMSAEKSGKYFMKTLRRSEGLYFTNAEGQQEQLCRLNTFDLQQMIEQTCMEDSIYPPEAGSEGSIERRRWLTMLLRENDINKHGDIDGKFLTTVIKDKIGEAKWGTLNDMQRGEILKNYETMVKDVIFYEAITDRIGECFENAEFGKDAQGNVKFALWQRIPEMWMKNSRVGVRFFILKYGAANMLEFTKVMDNILPSFFLYRSESMTHLTNKGGATAMFFEGENAAEYGEKFAKMMEETIITWNLGEGDNEWLEFGVRGRKDTAMRRGNGEVRRRLLLEFAKPENRAMFEAMRFDNFKELTGINILGSGPAEKALYFIKHYSDGYYDTDKQPAKGWADWVGKFKGEKAWGVYELLIPWANNPQNFELMSKVWGAISTYTPPDLLWGPYEKFMREKGKTVGLLGSYTTVKRDASGKLTAWEKDNGHSDTALPVPQMKRVTGAEMALSQHGGKNQIEAETKFLTGEMDQLMEVGHRDMAKRGWATQDVPMGKRWEHKFEEIFAPYKNGYVNLAADLLVLPIAFRLLKKFSGFHDNAEVWHWLLIEPAPEWFQNWLEIFGVKFKLK